MFIKFNAQTRKVLFGIILAGIALLLGFGAGGSTAARAKAAGTATPTVASNTPVLPLYPSLTWQNKGTEVRTLTINKVQQNLSGDLYKATAQFTHKLPMEVAYYYSDEQLDLAGWNPVYAYGGNSGTSNTYYHASGRFISVDFLKCSKTSSLICITIWESQFTNIVPTLQTKSNSTMITQVNAQSASISVPLFSQNNSNWAGDTLGYPSYSGGDCSYSTIGNYGCWVTSYAMVYDKFQRGYTNPGSLNQMLIDDGLYSPNGRGCSNIMHVNPLPDPPEGVSYNTYHYNYCSSTNCLDDGINSGDFDIASAVKSEINNGRPVPAYVWSSQTDGHMVVITGYDDSGTWNINDPWDGYQHTLSSGALGSYVVDDVYLWNYTQPLSPGSFSLSSPISGATGLGTNVTLMWGPSSNATYYDYCIDTDTPDNRTCNTNWNTIGNTTTTPISNLIPGKTYYWQVRAWNSVDSTDATDGWWFFTTQPASYLLSVSKTGTGSGTVTSVPAGISCGSTCSASFSTSVTLTATPATGSTFTGWSGSGCSGTGICTVTMDAVKSVTADFSQIYYELAVSKTGTGSGTVTSNPAGINCGSTCSASFLENTTVTLTAAGTTGSAFTGWAGVCTGKSTCTVTMNAAKSVTANFTLSYTLNVSISGPGNAPPPPGSGSGSVTSIPAGILCGSTCTASFLENTPVTLTATADTGSTFLGWSGACSGTGTCGVTMTADKSVTANFTLSYMLTVSKYRIGSGGTVTSNPAGINCGETCIASFSDNTSVTLTATADTGFTFTGWRGACSGTGSCTVTMTTNRLVTYGFIPTTPTLSIVTAGLGTVTSNPAGINCGLTCSASFNYGTVVTLTAVASTGSTFTGWGGSCSGTGTCTVTMSSIPRSVTAYFNLNPFTLSVSKSGAGTVTSNPAGINCGSTCTASFNPYTSVTLTAKAAIGIPFAGWGGACSGTFRTCTVTMTEAKSVWANFGIIE